MPKLKHLNPADYVILVFGGVRSAARALNKAPGTVSKWSVKETEGRRLGTIPTKSRRVILDYAKKHKLPITSEDLDFGRRVGP